jgi:uncharacterized membrane protein YhaH (DUF805 family)
MLAAMGFRKEWAAPLAPMRVLFYGVALSALKLGLDYAVAGAFDEPFSPAFYVSPTDAPLLRPGEHLGYWLALWAAALPFMGVGLWLTIRRLADAGTSPWLAALFFVPFANLLFFGACVLLPSLPKARPVAPPGYREPAGGPRPPARSAATPVLGGATAGAVMALGAVGLSVGIFGEYGAALFLGAPALTGFLGTLVHARLGGEPSTKNAIATALLGLALSYVGMLVAAVEGAICLLMAAPLAILTALVGGAIALVVVRGARPNPAVAFALGPVLILAEGLAPLPPMPDTVVESQLIVDAPPEEVFRYVVAFPDLGPATEWIFRAGVAAPMGATIDGHGVGAVRHCRFTTGEFIEPITAWDEGRELAFTVREQPDPMQELSPWDIRPPHLDGGFRTTAGQFLLEPLPGGRTRLIGRTHYVLDLAPRAYWSAWSDYLIHRIHMRVLEHVKRMAESGTEGVTES